ncbi:MAG: O-methyltransferase [Chryseolinea sp.]
METSIYEKVDRYIEDLLGQEDESLRAAATFTESSKLPPISITANQGKFLQVMAMACGAKRILEIGTLGAYSTIWLAKALPSDGKIISLEYDPKHADVAKTNIKNAGLSSQVEVRIGKALDLLPLIEKEKLPPFDMIFIDADKQPYTEYFDWAVKLGRPGAVIIADNVIRAGRVLNPDTEEESAQGVQRMNKMLSGRKDVTATIIQNVGSKEHDGMAIAVINK